MSDTSNSNNNTTPPPSTVAGLQGAGTGGLFGSGTPSPTNAATNANNGTFILPAAAESEYQYQNFSNDPVKIGAQVASILHISQNGQTINTVAKAFSEASQSALTQLEQLLWNAGMYVDAEGDPLETAPAFGTADNQSLEALLNALTQSVSENNTLDDTLASRIESGAGAAEKQAIPQAVTGGGHTYQIELTNPDDLYQALQSSFQSALGRNPTQSELDNFVSTFQSSQYAQQQAANSQQEQASVSQYQSQVASRNAQTAAETTPRVAQGQVPSGPFNSPAAYAQAIIQYMGYPTTQSNIQTITGMINALGLWGNGQKNPLGSELGVNGSTTKQNGQQSYQNWAQSIQATASALQNYPNLLAALSSGDATSQLSSNGVQADIKKWSDGKLSNLTSDAHKAKGAAANVIRSQPASPVNSLGGTANATHPEGPIRNPQPSPQLTEDEAGLREAQQSQFGPTTTTTQQQQTHNTRLNSIPPADIAQNQTPSAPGDIYTPPTTLEQTQAPSPSAAAFTAATTGANAVPYLGYQYLEGYNAIVNMIKSGGPTGG